MVGARGPDGGAAAGFERIPDQPNPARGIEPGVGLLSHRGRAIVDVEQDRVVPVAGTGADDDVPDVFGINGDAWIVHQGSVDRRQELAVPIHDLRD